jgi:glutathione S-transferase
MITLYKSREAWGTPDISPFAIKLETYLRMANLPYEVRKADIRKAPKGKIPYVDIEGTLMGDSQLIIEHLKSRHGDVLDAHLSPEQRAKGHAVRRMLEEATYFIGVYYRWVDDHAYAVTRPEMQKLMPAVIGSFIVGRIRKKIRATVRAQGTGRHLPAEIAELGKADFTALSLLLGDQPFLLGEKPTSFDATVYAFLVAFADFPVESSIRTHVLETPNLVAYVERFKARFWAPERPVQ